MNDYEKLIEDYQKAIDLQAHNLYIRGLWIQRLAAVIILLTILLIVL